MSKRREFLGTTAAATASVAAAASSFPKPAIAQSRRQRHWASDRPTLDRWLPSARA